VTADQCSLQSIVTEGNMSDVERIAGTLADVKDVVLGDCYSATTYRVN